MKRPLAYYGNPILRMKAKQVEEIDHAIKALVEDMIDTLFEENGVGLAAPQIHQSLALFITCDWEKEKRELNKKTIQVYINPKILSISKETATEEEGCLSIPKLYASVPRPLEIEIEAKNLEGAPFQEKLNGFSARRFLHENDHLNGVLFIDRLDKKTKGEIAGKLREIKKNCNPSKKNKTSGQ